MSRFVHDTTSIQPNKRYKPPSTSQKPSKNSEYQHAHKKKGSPDKRQRRGGVQFGQSGWSPIGLYTC